MAGGRSPGWVPGLALAALALIVWLAWRPDGCAPGADPPADPSPTPGEQAPQLLGVGEGVTPRRAPPPSGARGGIVGRVVGPEGEPVPGLRVCVDAEAARGTPEPASDVPRVRWVACDAEARFDIPDLAAGYHDLQVVDGRQQPGEVHAAYVEPGPEPTEVTLRVPTSWPVAGVVVDPQGDPVPALTFSVRPAEAEDRNGPVLADATTNAEGRFSTRVWKRQALSAWRMSRLGGSFRSGDTHVRLVYDAAIWSDVLIRVVDPDGVPVPRVQLSVMTGQGTSFGGGSYEVAGGFHHTSSRSWGPRTFVQASNPRDALGEPLPLVGEVRVDVPRDARECVVRFDAARAIAGEVVDEAGRGVEHVRVDAWSQDLALGRADTDVRGRFRLERLPPAPVTLRVRTAAPWAPLPPLEVPANRSHARFELRRGATYVVEVLDVEGRPTAGVPVQVDWMQGTWQQRAGVTDAAGLAVLEGVPTDARLGVRVDPRRLPGGLPYWQRSDLPFGEGRLTARLEPASPITGRVTVPDGVRIADYQVNAQGTDDHTYGMIDTAEPDPETGAFVLRHVREGPYRLWLQPARNLMLPRGREVHVGAPAQGVTLLAPRAAKLHGTLHVEDADAWSVTWTGGGLSQVARAGHFTILGARDERGSLLARRAGDSRVALLEDVRPEDGPHELRLVEGRRIAGRVQGAEGRGFLVYVTRGDIRLWCPVDEEGRFALDAVPPGTWTVELWRNGAARLRREDVAADASDLVLEAPR